MATWRGTSLRELSDAELSEARNAMPYLTLPEQSVIMEETHRRSRYGAELERDKSEVIECGRLPMKKNGTVDLYKIDRLLLELDITADRVAVLRRLVEFRPQGHSF